MREGLVKGGDDSCFFGQMFRCVQGEPFGGYADNEAVADAAGDDVGDLCGEHGVGIAHAQGGASEAEVGRQKIVQPYEVARPRGVDKAGMVAEIDLVV